MLLAPSPGTGGAPTANDKGLTPLSTSGDGSQTGLTLTAVPNAASYLTPRVNGISYGLGDGVKTEESYFSADGGTTAKTLATFAIGDEFIWNGVIAGFELVGADIVDSDYDN